MDTKNGPAAVIRNIACAFRGLPYQGRRLVVADRYYTSIPLAQQLRTMGFNYVGTVEETEDSFTQSHAPPTDQRVPEQPVVAHGEHALTQTTDARLNNGVQRLRQRQCKVCSVYKPEGKKRGGTSTYYCMKCSEGKRGLITLSNKVRGHPLNEGFTCSQIWHIVWENGEFALTASHIRDRGLVAE
ncbi:hypothetical protein PHMEG_00023044 [Phytophthora megakarya]|uniref:PiggyBac transposable element-derived protein domain-containing protein n=1 Tax=Phytophthora megakarya TaxID=4795 RepID=A0A225VJA1_9STRA|nr:hypothetical protein PHMEG_00023044 [Phytophthora megakarya]